MGRDKAGLIIDGQLLWRRQLMTLGETHPGELFISGKIEGPYAGAGWPIVVDPPPSRGPLSGLAAALRHARYEQLLVLAIDLPAMTAEFLSALRRSVTGSCRGIVSERDDFFEPLAAIYSRSCLPLAEQCLRGEDHSMQHFIRLAVAQELLGVHKITGSELPLFRNLNSAFDC